MNKKLIVSAIAVIIVVSLLLLVTQSSDDSKSDLPKVPKADIVMTPQSSRPGCDKTDTCYVPSSLTITKGQTVTWKNQDSGFHTVTSGTYDNPDGKFDSGHINPDDTFSYTFEDSGSFDFFCTLHPWMYGKIIVQ